jgi:hypothetical protein
VPNVITNVPLALQLLTTVYLVLILQTESMMQTVTVFLDGSMPESLLAPNVTINAQSVADKLIIVGHVNTLPTEPMMLIATVSINSGMMETKLVPIAYLLVPPV